MVNEKRLIDANELTDRLKHTTMVAYPNLYPGLLAAVEIVDDSPTVDAVEVIRCKNCKRWKEPWLVDQVCGLCLIGKTAITEPDHFCSYGGRRTDV